MTSSWDFPSVMRIPILGTPGREPDSGLKQFSRMKFKARPGEEGGDKGRKEEKKKVNNSKNILEYIGIRMSK